jgi:hypothetical protein
LRNIIIGTTTILIPTIFTVDGEKLTPREIGEIIGLMTIKWVK